MTVEINTATANRCSQLDKSEVTTFDLPLSASHGATEASASNISVDGAGAVAGVEALARGAEVSVGAEAQRTRAVLEQLQQKILKSIEQIRIEQEARNDNVAEYLKLAHNANSHQAFRIKQVFEKKNQKSAQTIAHLHKKLDHYHKKFKEIQQQGLGRQPKDVLGDMQQGLKDVGANVRAGISSFGGGVVEGVKGGVSELTHTAVVSKPLEFVSLIRNKFGSTHSLEDGVEEHLDDVPLSSSVTLASSSKYSSDDECSSDSVTSSNYFGAGGGGGVLGLEPSRNHHHRSWDTRLEGLQEIKASQAHMEDAIEDMKSQLQSDYSYMTQCLQEEKYRYELLEEQLNDLTELHQNQMSNLIQELASMEEKVTYQSYERTRDSQEAVESCMNRITRLELQQQQQQMLQWEGVENANAHALLGKLINIILAVMAVVLVFVSTPANFITPLIKTRARVAATVLLAIFLFILWKYWDFRELWLLPG
ncbi:transmembrane and coiled-coil domains protein 2-like [Salvelinus fontinalis]|uniref:transmembrane and coiled-coil domains protein 2-like n=1 Tax=Salvelinus fontinalis TaxID=8038 RepID=UPI002486A35A|nr:transmembrane and coiled-coil domains protein 2-like [Salvelinus fontinalis]